MLAPAKLGVLFGALLLWAFATDMVWPSQQRRIVELSAGLRGVALALTATFALAGIAFGSAIAGPLYEHFGYRANLLTSLGQLLPATACLVLPISKYAHVRAARPG